jgi:hypothetical protein
MATTLGSDEANLDARSSFFEERFCGWISELLNRGG